ncbi:MAG: phosphoglucosamine mutase [Candidatus Omnitrophota bacterium]
MHDDLKISISGVRGIVGQTFTDTLVSEFARAFSSWVKGGKVLVAQDTRQSGRRFRSLLLSTLLKNGSSVVDLGVAPTPTVLFMVRHLRARGAVIVTASHNPSEWNGLKFVGADGQFLDEKCMKRLVRIRAEKVFPKKKRRRGTLVRNRRALREHMHQVLRHLDIRKIRARRFRVAIDPCNGTGAVITPQFLRKLGCRVLAINQKPDGRFAHAPEPKEENLGQLAALVKRRSADIGFAQDPDGDRLAVVTEKGKRLSGEYTLALAVQWVLSKTKTPVVVNLSTSRMVETLARKRGVSVHYSKVGERNVIEKMLRLGAAIGGEGNGGVIYPKMNPARDSFLGMGLLI